MGLSSSSKTYTDPFTVCFTIYGNWIAFASIRQGKPPQIHRVHFESGVIEALVRLSGHSTESDLSPDGRRLVVACRPAGLRSDDQTVPQRTYDLYVVDAQWTSL